MKPFIKLYKPEYEYYTQENCFINEISNSNDDPELSIAQARVKPGITTRWHRLINTIERYSITSGQGLVEVGDLKGQQVKAGDIVIIPADCRQRIKNTGQTDLKFLAICTPRFLPKNYIDMDGQGIRDDNSDRNN